LTATKKDLSKLFFRLFASKRREYARVLMGVGEISEARKQLQLSFRNSINPSSVAKSMAWLFLTHLPGAFQPTWPKPYRVHRDSRERPI